MSIIENEKTEQNFEPIELYDIKCNGKLYRLTSYNEDYTLGSTKYLAIQIKRNEIVQDPTSFDDRIKITIPLRSNTAREISQSGFEGTSEVKIIRLDKASQQKYILWSGVIVQRNCAKESLELVCLPSSYLLEKTGNRAKYNRTCRHILYSKKCGLTKSDHAHTNNIKEENFNVYKMGKIIDVTFIGGVIEIPRYNITRLIIDVNLETNSIILINPFNLSLINENVILYKGCDKSMITCANRFNNIDNFGGFPFIPVRNIFSGSIT